LNKVTVLTWGASVKTFPKSKSGGRVTVGGRATVIVGGLNS
jgi:hypothetical protein